MNIAELSRRKVEPDVTKNALADYRALLRKKNPTDDDISRFKEVCRVLKITEPEIASDQQAAIDLANYERCAINAEQMETFRQQRASAGPAALASLVAIVAEAFGDAPTVDHVAFAVREMLMQMQWLKTTAGAPLPKLIGRINEAMEAYRAIPDPGQLQDNEMRRQQSIATMRSTNPRLFAAGE